MSAAAVCLLGPVLDVQPGTSWHSAVTSWHSVVTSWHSVVYNDVCGFFNFQLGLISMGDAFNLAPLDGFKDEQCVDINCCLL